MNTLEGRGLPTTAILGVGAMGGAILNGLLAPSVSLSSPLRVTTVSDASKEKFINVEDVVAHSLESDKSANIKAVRDAEIIILGVKPPSIKTLVEEIAAHVKPDAVIISIAAGIPIANIKEPLPETVSVIRAMPNTPVLVGHGVTGIVALSGTSGQALDVTRRLFKTVGEVIMLEPDSEHKLNALAAISGGGPAYVYLFIEKMTAEAVKLGFSEEQAQTMVQQTFLGSSLLLKNQSVEPRTLRKNVTSPNGTTEQAIKAFENADLTGIIHDAFKAAIVRAEQMAQE